MLSLEEIGDASRSLFSASNLERCDKGGGSMGVKAEQKVVLARELAKATLTVTRGSSYKSGISPVVVDVVGLALANK